MKYAKQRTDKIHGTVYLSSFESKLTSTPFFYRLHDIYQSSTVYLTFPSNRTKRYEHSLGTMYLASELLFSCITNADINVRERFFSCLNDEFQTTCIKFLTDDYNADYFGNHGKENIRKIITEMDFSDLIEHDKLSKFNQELDKVIQSPIAQEYFSDDALNHFSLHTTIEFEKKLGKGDKNSSSSVSAIRQTFLYQCILQAVRIVALFHDVGHPPFSHIIEQILEDLYKEFNAPESTEGNGVQCKKLIETLDRYLNSKEPQRQAFVSSEGPSASYHLHEQVGFQLLRNAIESVFPDVLNSIIQKADASNAHNKCRNRGVALLYYINTVEYAAAILMEKNNLFRSIHRLIDGTIDSDRLDYTVRDSLNSGVDWGTIPYKRLIDSAKLICINSDGELDKSCSSSLFAMAFPQKVSSDIEDFFVMRYKIYTYINGHHRCVKTATALQSAVRILAKDFLTCPEQPLVSISDPDLKDIDDQLLEILKDHEAIPELEWDALSPDAVCPNIHILWTALSPSTKDKNLKVLQWNDSWMVSILQSSLLRIHTETCFKDKLILQAVRSAWYKKHSSDEAWIRKSTEEKRKYLNAVKEQKEKELRELQNNLEEFLLNKKSHYTMFKRGSDFLHFVNSIFKSSELSLEDLNKQLSAEYIKFYSSPAFNSPDTKVLGRKDVELDSDLLPKNSLDDATEAIRRLKRFIRSIEDGALQDISVIFPTEEQNIEEIISHILKEAVVSGLILDYTTHFNKSRNKMGLPPHDGDFTKEIYLYEEGEVWKYDELFSLKPQLMAIMKNVPWFYVYLILNQNENPVQELDSIRLKCAQEIGRKIRDRYKELFP